MVAELVKAVLGAVAKVRKELSKSKPKLGRGRPSSKRAKKAARRTEDGHERQRFRDLLAELATQCRNTCEFGNFESPLRVTKLTDPTPLGREAFRLLQRARSQPT